MRVICLILPLYHSILLQLQPAWWKIYFWYSSSENSPYCAQHQLLLLGHCLCVHQFLIGGQEESNLTLPPAPGIHAHEQLSVAHIWYRSLVTQKLLQLLPPSHFKAQNGCSRVSSTSGFLQALLKHRWLSALCCWNNLSRF